MKIVYPRQYPNEAHYVYYPAEFMDVFRVQGDLHRHHMLSFETGRMCLWSTWNPSYTAARTLDQRVIYHMAAQGEIQSGRRANIRWF